MDYILGAIYLILAFSLYYFLGYSFTKKKTFSCNVLYGYFIYSFVIAIGLILIQILHLPWIFSISYFLICIILLVATVIYIAYKREFKVDKNDVKEYFKNNYITIFIVFFLMILMIYGIRTMWLNNHLDDGFYLGKIFQLPRLEKPYAIAYPTGIFTGNVFDTYSFNTWEAEAAIISSIFNINIFVFTRFFLSFHNYALLVFAVYEFSKELISFVNKDYNIKFIQFSTIVLVMFACGMEVVYRSKLMLLQDYWRLNSAMYYGDSLVRYLSVLAVVTLFLKNKKITFKDILALMMIGVVMISKTTTAIPTLICISIAVFCGIYCFEKKLYPILLMVVVLCIGIFLPNINDVQVQVLNSFKENLKTWASIISLIVFAFSFLVRNVYINKLNTTIIIYFLLSLVPEINDIFENSSQFSFVGLRSLTSGFYLLYITSFNYFLLFCYDFFKNRVFLTIGYSIMGVFCILSILSHVVLAGGFFKPVKLFLQNPKLVPNSTELLADKLDSYAKDNDDFGVLVPTFVTVDGYPHSLAVILRSLSSNIVSVSAVPRFIPTSNDIRASFTSEEQGTFEAFNAYKDYESYNNISSILSKYDIDAFVLTGDTSSLDSIIYDYICTDQIQDKDAGIEYSIWKKR